MDHSAESSVPVPEDVVVPELVLKEWRPQTSLLAKIPEKAQKGFQTLDLHLTCVGVTADYIALGTNVGIVYWYNRKVDSLERLKFEGINTSPIACISVISCESYMVAAGNRDGVVGIFQIPKTVPEETVGPEPPIPFRDKSRKVKIYTVRDIHNSRITSLTWSSNGMKLFSGDLEGIVAETQIDFCLGLCKSCKLFSEDHEVVQLSYSNQSLLVSTIQRTILYSTKLRVATKVGNQERKTMGPYGAVFAAGLWNKNMKLYAARPALRLWLADQNGMVQNTLLYKESIKNPYSIIPLLNPALPQKSKWEQQFSTLYNFMSKYLVTCHNNVLYILDPSTAKVASTCHFSAILSIDVYKSEIFVMDSYRKIIRIAPQPEDFVVPEPIPRGLLDGINVIPGLKPDFRIPDQPFKLIASKIKETSRAIPKFNSSAIISTMRNVLEADLNIQDGYIANVIPMGVPTLEVSEAAAETPLSPEIEECNTQKIEKFDEISNLSFQEVLLDQFRPERKRTKKRNGYVASSDSVSLSSQGSSTTSETVSSGTTPENEHVLVKSLSPAKDSGIGCYEDLVPFEMPPLPCRTAVSGKDLQAKEEMLAKMLKWSELLPSFEGSTTLTLSRSLPKNSSSSDVSDDDTTLSKLPYVQTNVDSSMTVGHTEGGLDYEAILTEMKTIDTHDYALPSTSYEIAAGSDADAGAYDHYPSIYDQSQHSGSGSSKTMSEFFGPPSGSSNLTLCEPNAGGTRSLRLRIHSGPEAISLPSILPLQDMRVKGEILNDYWIQYELPSGVTSISTSDKYLTCTDAQNSVYYSSLAQESNELRWIKANFLASLVTSSADGCVTWRISPAGVLSGIHDTDPFSDPNSWEIISDKVKYAVIGQELAYILKTDHTLYSLQLDKEYHPLEFEYIPTPVSFVSVHVLDDTSWALGSDGRVFYRPTYSNTWNELRNVVATTMSLGPQRSIWLVDTQSQICFLNDFVASRGKFTMWSVSIAEELNHLVSPASLGLQSRSLSQWTQKLTRWSSSHQVSQDVATPLLSSCRSVVAFAVRGGNAVYLNKTCTSGHKWDVITSGSNMKNWKFKGVYAKGIYNNHGFLWLQGSKGKIFGLQGANSSRSLQPIDSPCSNIVTIAPAAEALWVLDVHGTIYGRCNINPVNELGNGWDKIELSPIPEDRKLVHVSCGSEIVWSCDDRGDIYIRNGSLNPPCSTDISPAWIKVDGSPNYGLDAIFTKVYVGPSDRIVFALDSRGAVYAREAVFPDLPIGTSWVLIPSVEAVSLAISETAVWALTPQGEIYRRSGISSTNFVGDSWKRIPGSAKVLTVSICDEVWTLDGNGVLLKHVVEEMYLRTGNDVMASKAKLSIVEDNDVADWELLG